MVMACDAKAGVLVDTIGRRELEVQGMRKRGRPKRRWLDRVRSDIKEMGLSGGGNVRPS